MEWIRISSNKLKIMLSAEDARHYALNCDSADYADSITREIFREILSDVQEQTGFDASDDKVYIQMYPSKEGGCELFITKMGLVLSDAEQPACAGVPHAAKKPLRGSKSPATGRKKRDALRFARFEDLLALSRRLSPVFHGKSSLWREENGIWWLLLEQDADVAITYRFLREYAHTVNPTHIELLLPEHGTPVCTENALHILAEL